MRQARAPRGAAIGRAQISAPGFPLGSGDGGL
jgi:hypothetical protein